MTRSLPDNPVETQQQPATKLLIQGVMPIANGGLRHLRQQGLRVTQQQMLHGAAMIEFLLEQIARQLVGIACALHDRTARRRFTAHEKRNTDDAFVANHCDFSGCAIRHQVQERNDGGRREIHVPQLAARFVQHISQRQRHEPQTGLQALEIRDRQGGQQVILSRIMRGGHRMTSLLVQT